MRLKSDIASHTHLKWWVWGRVPNSDILDKLGEIMATKTFHLEVVNPDNVDEMPLFDSFGDNVDELVVTAAKRLIPGHYTSIVTTYNEGRKTDFLYGMHVTDNSVQIRTNDGSPVISYEIG